MQLSVITRLWFSPLAIATLLSMLLGVCCATAFCETIAETGKLSVELEEELLLAGQRETIGHRHRPGFRYAGIQSGLPLAARCANPRPASTSEHTAFNGLGRPLTT